MQPCPQTVDWAVPTAHQPPDEPNGSPREWLTSLPEHLCIDILLPALGARDCGNMALTCRIFALRCRKLRQIQAQALCQMERHSGVLSRFGLTIAVHIDSAQRAVRVLAAVRGRVTEINNALPSRLRAACPVHDLTLNPPLLHTFLQKIYNHSLVQTFRDLVQIPENTPPEESLRLTQDYLNTTPSPEVTCLDISSREIACLPTELRRCTGLHGLFLSHNCITFLPSWVQRMPLSRIILDFNPLNPEHAWRRVPPLCSVTLRQTAPSSPKRQEP